MTDSKKLFEGNQRIGMRIGAIFGLAQAMTPGIVVEGLLKKRGFKPRKTEADVAALAAAAEKRARRAARNQRNADAMAAGQARVQARSEGRK